MGIAGLGRAGSSMISAFVRHPHVEVTAAARPDGFGLAEFARDFDARTHRTVEDLCRDPDVDAVYIATPTDLHAEHAVTAARAGKHILLEKPMASSMDEGAAIVEEAERAGVTVLIGHSHSYDPPVRAMRDLITAGRVGPVRMINSWYFSDWFYRPRRPAELDSSRGGGVTLRQGAHQFDIIRYLGGGLVRSVRAVTGSWDGSRPGQGAHAALLEFVDGTAATAVYSGYDHFPSHELTFGVTEGGGLAGEGSYGAARRRLAAAAAQGGELAVKQAVGYPEQAGQFEREAHQPFFGLTVVSCERGDLRQSRDGVLVYGDDGREEVLLTSPETPRDVVVAELYDAVVKGVPAVHDGRWGLATLEVCLAVLESARTRTEVELSHQVPIDR